MAALEEVHNKFKDIGGIKYLIFLTDGSPSLNDSDFNSDVDEKYRVCSKISTTGCKNEIKKYANNLKDNDNVTLIIIGYNDTSLVNLYGEISTPDALNYLCSNSNYTSNSVSYCYYDSSSDKLSELFGNISNTIKKVNDIQNVKKVSFDLKFNDSVKVYDSNDKLLKNNKVTVNFDMTKTKENTYSNEVTYFINIDELKFDNSKCDENDVCEDMILKLFGDNGFNINLYDKNKNLINNMNPNSSILPYLVISGTKKSYLN